LLQATVCYNCIFWDFTGLKTKLIYLPTNLSALFSAVCIIVILQADFENDCRQCKSLPELRTTIFGGFCKVKPGSGLGCIHRQRFDTVNRFHHALSIAGV
jgi:hypothetical protein